MCGGLFFIRQERENPTLTEWDRFAHREYIMLSMEEDVEDASNGSAEVWDLLNEFELILDSDPLIDEVGFIHPSQFATLEGNGESVPKEERAAVMNFWNREHKLGISTDVVIQLYRVAKDACLSAIGEYKSSQIENTGDSTAESDVLKHSKAVLLLSCDFGTAWNSRKLILSRNQHMPLFIDELCLSALVLSYSPKSDQAWCHRRWVIKMIAGKCSALQDVLATESDLVEKIAERSKMNYRAWNHRCWLVSYMAREQVLNELVRSRNWACLHVADSSCFHYRTRLLLRILEESSSKQEEICFNYCTEIYWIWQEELEWNEVLLRRYVGREALWLHRRFLSLCWIRHFATSPGDTSNHSKDKASTHADVETFLDNELHLVSSCSTVPDNDFEDFQAQEVYSAVYILWLMKQIPKTQGIELDEKLNTKGLKTMLNTARPERSLLWCNLSEYSEASV